MLLILWRIHSFHRHVLSAVHSETGTFRLNKLFTFKIICAYLIREKNTSGSSQRTALQNLRKFLLTISNRYHNSYYIGTI